MKAFVKSGGNFNESYIYIKGFGGEDKTVSITKAGGEWKEFTISDIKVTNGKCEVGVYTDGKANAWVRSDDFSLVAQ